MPRSSSYWVNNVSSVMESNVDNGKLVVADLGKIAQAGHKKSSVKGWVKFLDTYVIVS